MRKISFAHLLCIPILAMAAVSPAVAGVMPPRFRLEPVARGLTNPQAVALAPDGRIFYLERTTGNVRIIENGKLVATPFVTVSVSPVVGEEGLLGIALDPSFASNHRVYLYYTQASPKTNRIVRYTAFGNTGANPYVVLDNIGSAPHGEDNGGALAFGTDGKLYATVGVMEDDAAAQNDASPLGKVLQISFNADGTVNQVDNFAKGFRNSAGIAVNKNTGAIYVTDNYDDEPSAGCDEVDAVQSGLDYGWNGALDTCDTPGAPPSPLQTITSQITASAVAAYTGSEYEGFCLDNGSWVCTADADCGTCAATPTKRCATGSDCGVCANNPSLECTGSTCNACQNHQTTYCTSSAGCLFCQNNPDRHCFVDSDCEQGGGPRKCNQQDTCGPFGACNPGTCNPATCGTVPNTLVVAGQQADNTKMLRDVLTTPSYDTLAGSSDLYVPSGSDCPVGVRDVAEGQDGWLYTAADDTTVASRAGLYRVLYDSMDGPNAAPREVSGSPYLRMTLDKVGGTPPTGIQFWWEDLKRDAWGCSSPTPGIPSGTVTHCPTGSHSAKYTLWSGPLVSPFAYNHTATDVEPTDENDALVTETIAMPSDDRYYLVSARHADLEGSLGTRSDGVTERPGYATTDLCATIGYGTIGDDLNKCSGEFPHPYPDENNRMWSMSDFRGKAVVMSLMQYG